jgi:hypothetical protein
MLAEFIPLKGHDGWLSELWSLLRLAVPAVVLSCSTMVMTVTDQVLSILSYSHP